MDLLWFHFAIASLSGVASWAILSRHAISGDHACGVVFASFFGLLLYRHMVGDTESPYHSAQLLSVYLGMLATSTVVYRISPVHPLARFPGPFLWRISALVMVRVSYTGRRHLVLERLHQRYGPIVRIGEGPDMLSVNDGSELQSIYGTRGRMTKPDFYKLPGHPHVSAMFFKQSEEKHAARKQIWTQSFTPTALDNFQELLQREVWNLMRYIHQRTGEDALVPIDECLNRWAYDVTSVVAFGGSNGLRLMRDGDPDELVWGGKDATVHGDCLGQAPWLLDIMWLIWGENNSVKKLKKLAADMVHARFNAATVEVRDLMSYLMEGNPRTGEKVSALDLEIDAVVAIQGGSDNISTTLILCVYFLLSRPSLYLRLRKDLEQFYPDPTAALEKSVLTEIPLLDAIIYEALRFGSPYYLPRMVPSEGTTLAGRFVPGGTIVSSAAHAVQMSERNFYPDPREYLPERWLADGLGPSMLTNKEVLSSFTFGPHFCIGKQLAMQEMRMCLARLVLVFDLELPNGADAGGFYKGLRNYRTTIFDKQLVVKAVCRPGVHIPDYSE